MLPSWVDRLGVAVISRRPHHLPLIFCDNRAALFCPVVRKEFAHLLIVPDFLTALLLASSFRRERSPIEPRNGWLLTLDRNHVLIPQHPPSLSECHDRPAEQRPSHGGGRKNRSNRPHLRQIPAILSSLFHARLDLSGVRSIRVLLCGQGETL